MKDSTVSARINTDVKEQAEEILNQIGIPVSVLIDCLYRQIIYQRAIPFPLTVPEQPKSLEEMSDDEIEEKLMRGYKQAKNGETIPFDDFLKALNGRY